MSTLSNVQPAITDSNQVRYSSDAEQMVPPPLVVEPEKLGLIKRKALEKHEQEAQTKMLEDSKRKLRRLNIEEEEAEESVEFDM